ncbi:MAG: hypothetical protein QE487_16680 [Fluviicola sp.]|nr:hypothetical protein [Fluviicola sp.]
MKNRILIFFILINTHYFSQIDSLKIYKEIFIDKNNIYNGKRIVAFYYLLNQIKIDDNVTKRELKSTFGIESVFRYKGYKIYTYLISGDKYESPEGEISYYGGIKYEFRFKRRKLNSEHSSIIG